MEWEIKEEEGIEFDTNNAGINKIYFGDRIEINLSDEEVETLFNQIKKSFVE